MKTPVVFLFFNRPHLTARVFDVIREVRPSRLLLVSDGAREGSPDEASRVAAARAVVEQVDWKCHITRNYAEINLGVGRRVSSGLDWAFSQVEEAIILEDDCLPDVTFFNFCSSLLARYRHDERVMMVSGTNHLLKWCTDRQDYHFSVYGSIWGWATWRRAWSHYDFELRALGDPRVRQRIDDLLGDPEQFEYRLEVGRRVQAREVDTWDYQWTWSRLARGGLSAVSAVNLVSNIGIGISGTNTTDLNLVDAHLNRYQAAFPLRAPNEVAADSRYDRKCFLRMRRRPDLDSIAYQGEELLKSNCNIHALIFFEEACRIAPGRTELHYYRALALSRLGQTEKARDAVEYLLAAAPQHERALELRALLSQT
jgi:hypothetical protein